MKTVPRKAARATIAALILAGALGGCAAIQRQEAPSTENLLLDKAIARDMTAGAIVATPLNSDVWAPWGAL